MAIKISITKKLEADLRGLLESAPVMERHGKTIRQLVATIDDAQDKKTAKAESVGVEPKAVIAAIKGVLGSKAYHPPNAGQAFFAYVGKRCKFLNVSIDDIEKAAVHVRNGSRHVKLPTSVEWFIKQLDRVLEEMAQIETGEEEPVQECQIEIGR